MKRLLREIRERLWLWWFWRCAYDQSEQGMRARLEAYAQRFGGRIEWAESDR